MGLLAFILSFSLSAPLAAKTISRSASSAVPSTLGAASIGLSLGNSNLPSLAAPGLGDSALVLPQTVFTVSEKRGRVAPRRMAAAAPTRVNAAVSAPQRERREGGIKAGLVRFAEAIGKKTAPLRGMMLKLFDGSELALVNAADEHAAERAYAHVENRAAREEVRHAEQKLPVYDYLRTAFHAERAKEEFLNVEFDFSGETKTGRAILEFLLTPHAVAPDIELEPERMDMPLFGRSDSAIRDFSLAEGIRGWRFNEVMVQAFRLGLIYRVHDREGGKSYTGIPAHVRAALDLEAPPIEVPVVTENDPASDRESMTSLGALVARMEILAGKDELFEFAAQAADAAVGEGRMQWDDLPESFRKKAEPYRGEAGTLADAIITLVESAHETEWFDEAVTTAYAAADDGIIEPALLREILSSLD
ncbi:MAG: hypothetical protein COB53_03990 [Elusimicrobia bacterium]|nr:MAG: hypothetical protein COB53_03990 [Elusimicrobiota bacterium]